jgi:hypothetical protein
MIQNSLEAHLQQPLSVLVTWLSVPTLALQAARVEPNSNLEDKHLHATSKTPDHLSGNDLPIGPFTQTKTNDY